MKKILIKIYKFMTKIISKFKNSFTGEVYQIGAGEGGGSFDPAIVEQIYQNLRKEISEGDAVLHNQIIGVESTFHANINDVNDSLKKELLDVRGDCSTGDAQLSHKIDTERNNLQDEINLKTVALYPDNTIDEVIELIGDDTHVGKVVAVIEDGKVVEYCFDNDRYIEFHTNAEGRTKASRYREGDIKGDGTDGYDLPYLAWKSKYFTYYTMPDENVKNVFSKTVEGMTVTGSNYTINSGCSRKTVFFYKNNDAVAVIDGKEVMRINANGKLTISDGTNTASISPQQLAALVATLN
jgi:hypothetical protein